MCGQLLDELVADSAGAADEKVEFFVVAHEEGVVQDVEGFAQQGALDDERDAHFERAEGNGVHTDAVATENGEQATDGAGVLISQSTAGAVLEAHVVRGMPGSR